MNQNLYILISFLFIVLLAGCRKDLPTVDYPDFTVPEIISGGDENYLQEDSDFIFDQSVLHTFHLEIPGTALQQINIDPTAEEYVEGMLIFNNDTISPVGVRYKGSVGGYVGCVSGNDWTNPSGYKTCSKLSMKVKINWEGRQEKFYKLKKLQFHSMNLDDSKMRDRSGYWLFGQMGVPSPRCVHAKLMINGDYAGLFSLVEQIDSRFAKYHFEDDDGNIYKEIWPVDGDGNVRSDNAFRSGLKTNENSNPSFELIKTLGESIESAEVSQRPAIVENLMDIDETMAMIAVDRTIRHDDGPFHWYCFNGCNPHNFYWYEEPNNKKIHLIPWDLDNAFENIINASNPVTAIADDFGETRNNCLPFAHGAYGYKQISASCDNLTAAWASFDELLNEKMELLKTGPLSQEEIENQINVWSEQIKTAVQEENETFNDVVTTSQWESAISEIIIQLAHARNN